MDAFEAARQAFFSGSVTNSTVFTQAKSVDGMNSVPALQSRSTSKTEEKLTVVR